MDLRLCMCGEWRPSSRVIRHDPRRPEDGYVCPQCFGAWLQATRYEPSREAMLAGFWLAYRSVDGAPAYDSLPARLQAAITRRSR